MPNSSLLTAPRPKPVEMRYINIYRLVLVLYYFDRRETRENSQKNNRRKKKIKIKMTNRMKCPSCSVSLYLPDIQSTGTCPLCNAAILNGSVESQEKIVTIDSLSSTNQSVTEEQLNSVRNKSASTKGRIVGMMIQDAAQNTGEPRSKAKHVGEVRPGLYLGGINVALDRPYLRQHNIQSIINCTTEIPCVFKKDNFSTLKSFSYPVDQVYMKNEEEIEYLHIRLVDEEIEQIGCHFDETYAFLESALKRGSVLVHCAQGVSRSASVVAAYLIRKEELTLKEALASICVVRQVHPNRGFMKQLENYEHRKLDR